VSPIVNSGNVTGSNSIKIALIVLIVFVAGLASGVFLIPQLNRNGASNQTESVELTDQSFWGGNVDLAGQPSNWTEAAIAVTNTGNSQVLLKGISVSGISCDWNDVYYWKSDYGPPAELKKTFANFSGASCQLTIDGIRRTFQRANGEIGLGSQWTAVLYAENPLTTDLTQIPSKVMITVHTENSLYYKQADASIDFVFMKAEQYNVAAVNFCGTSGQATNYINITLQNTGTASFIIDTAAKVNGVAKTLTAQVTIAAGSTAVVKIPNVGWVNGNQYSMELLTTQGTKITYIANAPGT